MTLDEKIDNFLIKYYEDSIDAYHAVMGKSRRQLAEDGDTIYIDTIVELVHKLETP